MSNRSARTFELGSLANGWTVGRFGALAALSGIAHCVTTRQGFDVLAARDNPASAAAQVAQALGLEGAAFCRQVHGAEVLVVDAPGLAGEADGLVAGAAGLGLVGFSADCPIILAADPVRGAVGMAHASWRGTVARIARRLIEQMTGRFGTAPRDVTACLCPSAGPCCYQVGGDVVQAALAGIGPHAGHFFLRRQGAVYFNLWKANTDELLAAGVRAGNLQAADVCTICRNDLLPSYRKEGAGAGRFVAAIGLAVRAGRGWNRGSG